MSEHSDNMFSADEAVRLDHLRQQYQSGNLPEQTEFVEEYHRLDFVRWLVEQGKLNETVIPPSTDPQDNQQQG